MKETEFIKKNKEKWARFERILEDGSSSPEDLGRVFVETTDDLSYARTRYRNRSVRVYLNELAQRIYQGVYSGKQSKEKLSFWTIAAPSALYLSRKEILISFLVFIVSIFIGLVSSHYYPEFPSLILGDQYVAMTEANIENGDPMAVYKDMDAIPMFLMIAWNNIRVSFIVFVAGVFFSLGTIMALLRNGAMVGAFLAFFIQRDLFQESFFAIMLHGTLELSCIVLAGAAGLTLGRGILFPGSYSRLQSFLISARSGIKIMIAITPFLIIAALIESFATRYTEVPEIIRAIIILISLAIVIGYFIALPLRIARSDKLILEEDEVLPAKDEKPDLNSILKNGQIFTSSIQLLRKSLAPILTIGLVSGLICTMIMGFEANWMWSEKVNSDYFQNSLNNFSYVLHLIWFPDDIAPLFDISQDWLLIPVIYFTFFLLLRQLKKQLSGESKQVFHFKNIWLTPLIMLFPLAISPVIGLTSSVLLTGLVLPIAIYHILLTQERKLNDVQARSLWKLFFSRFSSVLGLLLVVSVFQLVLMMLLNLPIAYILFDFVLVNFKSDWAIAREIPFALYALISYISVYTLLYLSFAAFGLHFYSSLESHTARHLKLQLDSFGKQKRSYGIQKEA